jgi:hypothetical protein
MTSSRTRAWRGLAAVTVVCAACCAAPLSTLLGGVAVASTVAAIVVPAAGLIALIAVGIGWRLLRRRGRAGCTTDGPVDLGLPAAPR